jgi:hypothetical protein
MIEKKSPSEVQVEEWNEHCPVGTLVSVTKDDGEKVNTKTRSEAWMLGADSTSKGHTPVVLLEGISGAYLLSQVTPLKVVTA